MGGPTKALALPFDRLGELDLDDDGPWLPGGPVGPGCAIVAGAWFLMREVELSMSRASLVDFTEMDENGKWYLWELWNGHLLEAKGHQKGGIPVELALVSCQRGTVGDILLLTFIGTPRLLKMKRNPFFFNLLRGQSICSCLIMRLH